MDESMLEEIARWDENFVPEAPRHPRLEDLPNGFYDLTVLEALPERTRNTREPILRLVYRVNAGPVPPGLVFEQPYFFQRQKSVDRLGGDLQALGFDANLWTGRHGRKFSVELAKALPKLPGVRFGASKSAEAGQDGKTYHNLNIGARIDAKALVVAQPVQQAPQAPARNGPAAQPAPAQARAGQGGAHTPAYSDDDIPFSLAPFFLPWLGAALALGGFLA